MQPTMTATTNNIDYTQIPHECKDLHEALKRAGFPIGGLLEEIVSDDNLSDGFDYVVGHLETRQQREKYWPRKAAILERLKRELSDGTFEITDRDFREMVVTDGPKERVVQAPTVYHRIGCHVIMVVVERYINPTLITHTAASIKGKGMHWLFHRMEQMHETLEEQMQYFYKSDIKKYYDNISQEEMKAEIRCYICDERVLKYLDNFISLLPSGLSKGLRSSQCFANIWLSPVDHYLCSEVGSVVIDNERYHLYMRYMDDVTMFAGNKRELWRLRNIYHEQVSQLGHEIKADEAIRPLEVGLDFLGFIYFGSHSRLRKRTKQKAARHLKKVKSRRRIQELKGSFKGMACHADCKHLYYKLTRNHMKKFAELGVAYQPEDGKKRFAGKVVPIRSIANTPIEIHDYESDIKTAHGAGRYLVSFRNISDGTWAKFFTASKEMQNILDQVSDVEDGFPFETKIVMDLYDGKTIPKFT